MNSLSKLKKTKKLRMLILSAGGPQSGIQGICIGIQGEAWEEISHAVVPYPDALEQAIESVILAPHAPMEMEKLAALDRKMSLLFLESAHTVFSNAHKSLRKPHCIVLNKCVLYSGHMDDAHQARYWDVSLGDGQLLASAFGVPVVTDFVRHAILAGSAGGLPLFPGNVKIGKQVEPVSVYLNIGIVSHITVVDNQAMNTVLDSDIGPGTCLINQAAADAGSADGFDRDGSLAAKGKVDNKCLTELASQEWFARPGPKTAYLRDFAELYHHPSVVALSAADRITTLTALTARIVFEYFKREYRHVLSPETVWVSGGGAHNLTLMEYLSTYFNPLKVQSVEAAGIPAAMRIPLALGLSVHEFIAGHPGPWNAGNSPQVDGVGRWIFP
jgi:anhydro-N-acetylmuramic acid kinase